jgi:hypothetical protein
VRGTQSTERDEGVEGREEEGGGKGAGIRQTSDRNEGLNTRVLDIISTAHV